MKGSRIALTGAALASALAIAPVALAHDDAIAQVGVTANVNANVSVGANANAQASTSAGANSNAGGSATGTTARLEHQSTVAAGVRVLLNAATRDGGIGQEVRAIAMELASSSESVAEAKASVEGRPGWLVFIIGTDYGNLGKLRSEIATTKNQINRLENALGRTTDATAQAEITAQIAELNAAASTTAAFVTANESKFSLLGWFVKLFVSSEAN